MNTRYAYISIIVTVGLLVYLSATLAGFLSIDDVGMISTITSTCYALKDIFLTGANEYYRPLVVVSYIANAAFSGINPVGFHIVNITIHLLNSLLLYYLVISLLEGVDNKDKSAFVAALFFLVSPLNSEAVVWISARPDLLCTFFFLLALVLLVNHRKKASILASVLLFIAYLASLSAKEASIVLFLVAPIYLFTQKEVTKKHAFQLTFMIMLTVAVYLYLRMGKQMTVDVGIKGVIGNLSADVATKAPDQPSLMDAVAAYGFYLKKLLYPFPLNFTIMEFNKISAFIALIVAPIIGVVLFRCNKRALLPLLIVFVGIVPPVLAYLGKLPWTPFGERYLYLPMVGFSVLFSMVAVSIKKIPFIVTVSFVLLLALPTIDRVGVWCDAKAFWNDALEKTPGFPKTYSALGVVYLEEKNYEKAESYFLKALSVGNGESVFWKNLATVHFARKEYEQYEAAMIHAGSLSKDPAAIYQELIQAMMGASRGDAKLAWYRKAITHYHKAQAYDPSYVEAYYNIGKLYLALGETHNAKKYFQIYMEKSAKGPNRPFAFKMIQKVNSGSYR